MRWDDVWPVYAHAALRHAARRRSPHVQSRTAIASARGASKTAQAVRPVPTAQGTRVFHLSLQPRARFAHLRVCKLAAISTASQAQTACLTALIVSRLDRLAGPTRLRNACPPLMNQLNDQLDVSLMQYQRSGFDKSVTINTRVNRATR